MTERLDRIESLLLVTAERLEGTNATLAQVGERLNDTNAIVNQITVQQQRNTVEIDILLGAISTTDVEVRNLRESMTEFRESITELRESVSDNEQRFNILIQEMRADRRAMLLQITEVSDRVDDLEAG